MCVMIFGLKSSVVQDRQGLRFYYVVRQAVD